MASAFFLFYSLSSHFPHSMATLFNLQLQLFNYSRSYGLDIRKKTKAYSFLHANLNAIEDRNNSSLIHCPLVESLSIRKCSTLEASKKDNFSCTNQNKEAVNEVTYNVASSIHQGMELNRVDCVVWMLHESSRSFSQAIESLGVAKSGPKLTMAWIGKDARQWHRRIAYQVAVYALMKTAIDLEILLSRERQNEFSPVREILTPLINQMGEKIEVRLKMRHSYLVHWFRDTEIPKITAYFIPLLKNWSMEYAGSGIAGIIVAITCGSAVVKLGSRRICCPLLVLSLKDVLVKLMDFSLNLATLDKLHQLATEAGFEVNFLSHFGRKILPSEKTEDLEFWIGLAYSKLLKAFCEESIISNKQKFQHKIESETFATLGLFAYLGRMTRKFLTAMGIKDPDEMVKDFLSYLECGILFIYPEFSSIQVYELFMEVVTDEIGWLDFYASYVQINNWEKGPKHQACQAEKEIISSAVLTVCYDVFSGFAHFTRSTQQSLDTASLSYLLRCQELLSICIQDHWAAYTKSGYAGCGEDSCIDKSNPQQESFIKRYIIKFASSSANLWMGTLLLFIDVAVALELLVKQAKGCKASRSQKNRLERTMNDIIVLVPVTILMLIPVTAIGHAAILAAIKKYMPFLIPSSYSSERLDVVKQIKQTRESGDQLREEDLEEKSPTIS